MEVWQIRGNDPTMTLHNLTNGPEHDENSETDSNRLCNWCGLTIRPDQIVSSCTRAFSHRLTPELIHFHAGRCFIMHRGSLDHYDCDPDLRYIQRDPSLRYTPYEYDWPPTQPPVRP